MAITLEIDVEDRPLGLPLNGTDSHLGWKLTRLVGWRDINTFQKQYEPLDLSFVVF